VTPLGSDIEATTDPNAEPVRCDPVLTGSPPTELKLEVGFEAIAGGDLDNPIAYRIQAAAVP
jgi:hypothetical protein